MIEISKVAEAVGINPILYSHLAGKSKVRNQENQVQIKTEPEETEVNKSYESLKSRIGNRANQIQINRETEETGVHKSYESSKSRIRNRANHVQIKTEPEVDKSFESLKSSSSEIKRSLRIRLKPKEKVKKKVSYDALSNVEDIYSYHSHLLESEEYARKIIDLTKICHKSQLDAFEYQSNVYFLMSWLTSVRIFDYDCTNHCYNEITRIPKRYIEISPQIVTSIHFSDSKLYIAYLWGSHDEKIQNEKERTRPYLEVRDLKGNVLEEPYYYDFDDIVRSINSNEVFIWALTGSNIIHIHRKFAVHLFSRRVDFNSLGCGRIIDASVKSVNPIHGTNLQILIVTRGELIVAQYDVMNGVTIKQWLNLEKDYLTVAMIQMRDRVLLHRNSSHTAQPDYISALEIGYLQRFKSDHTDYFILQTSLRFKCRILDVCTSDKLLFLFGLCNEGRSDQHFELGCLDLKSCKPLWVEHLNAVDRDCHILVHDKNVILVKGSQEHCCIRIDTKTQEECQTCQINLLEKAQLTHNENHNNIFKDLRALVNKNVVY